MYRRKPPSGYEVLRAASRYTIPRVAGARRRASRGNNVFDSSAPRLRAAASLVLAFALGATPCLAQAGAASSLAPFLARLGFKKAAAGTILACEGVDLSGNEGPVPSSALPTIAYVFLPSQAAARASLSALERVREGRAKSLSVLALTAVDRGSAANAAKGLGLGFPILARSRGLEAFGSGATQAYLVLAPGGEVIAAKAGSLDWSSSAVLDLVDALVAAYPAGSGAPMAQAPSQEARPETAPAAAPPRGAPGGAPVFSSGRGSGRRRRADPALTT